MPLYEYHCRACGGRFERIRKFEERTAAQNCPRCSAAEVELALSVPAMVGTGSGGGAAFGESSPAGTGFGGCCGGGACGMN